MRRLALIAVLIGLVPVLGACSSDRDAIEVVSTNTDCTVGTTSFDAGKLTFKVSNKGDKTTELYVYGPDDKIMGEVENVGPGTSRTLTVDLRKGDYQLACKPGQTGTGIRQAITVTGEGGTAAKAPDREIDVKAADYTFSFPAGLPQIRKGETIEFTLSNAGMMDHEFEVLKPNGDALGEVGPTKPGKTGQVILTFDAPGTYEFVCGIDDHETRGMKGTFAIK